jgi:hypothetical protein
VILSEARDAVCRALLGQELNLTLDTLVLIATAMRQKAAERGREAETAAYSAACSQLHLAAIALDVPSSMAEPDAARARVVERLQNAVRSLRPVAAPPVF